MDMYNECCLETMRRFSKNSVDVVITSPPYNMNLRIRNGAYCSRQIVKEISTKYDGFADNLPIEDFYAFHKSALAEMLRVSSLVFYNIQIVTGSKRAFFKMIGDFSDNIQELIIWDKLRSQPAMQNGVLNSRFEILLVLSRDNGISRRFYSAAFKRGTLENLWQIRSETSKDKDHKATFPIELVRKILENFTREGYTVYDPFAGTGTTGVACMEMGRKCILTEKIPAYFMKMAERLREWA